MVSGHVVEGLGPSSLEVSENIGGEGQAKLRAKEADKAHKTLLDRDKEGMKAVITAREYDQKEEERKEDGIEEESKRDPRLNRVQRSIPRRAVTVQRWSSNQALIPQ